MGNTKTLPYKTAIAERLQEVRANVKRACERAGRSSEEVSLLAVTKTFPLEVVKAAREVGLQDFGENRVGELVEKAEAFPGAYLGDDQHRWHMIGHLQRNKARDVVEHADTFLALDSPRLARELEKRASSEDRVLPCLVQVNITRQDRKYGIEPDDIHTYLDSLADYEHIMVYGLMAMAEHVDDPEEVRPQFKEMKQLFDTYDDQDNPAVSLRELSMGMSNDYAVAVEEGSTQIRLGSALFGARDYN